MSDIVDCAVLVVSFTPSPFEIKTREKLAYAYLEVTRQTLAGKPLSRDAPKSRAGRQDEKPNSLRQGFTTMRLNRPRIGAAIRLRGDRIRQKATSSAAQIRLLLANHTKTVFIFSTSPLP